MLICILLKFVKYSRECWLLVVYKKSEGSSPNLEVFSTLDRWGFFVWSAVYVTTRHWVTGLGSDIKCWSLIDHWHRRTSARINLFITTRPGYMRNMPCNVRDRLKPRATADKYLTKSVPVYGFHSYQRFESFSEMIKVMVTITFSDNGRSRTLSILLNKPTFNSPDYSRTKWAANVIQTGYLHLNLCNLSRGRLKQLNVPKRLVTMSVFGMQWLKTFDFAFK